MGSTQRNTKRHKDKGRVYLLGRILMGKQRKRPDGCGAKHDAGKLRYSLLPVHPIAHIVKVLTLGATKYTDRNWEKGFPWSDIYDATKRHLEAWWDGQDLDTETSITHLAHAACNLLFLIEFEKTHKELDNRPGGDGKGLPYV